MFKDGGISHHIGMARTVATTTTIGATTIRVGIGSGIFPPQVGEIGVILVVLRSSAADRRKSSIAAITRGGFDSVAGHVFHLGTRWRYWYLFKGRSGLVFHGMRGAVRR